MEDFKKYIELNFNEIDGFKSDLGNNKLMEDFISDEKKNSLCPLFA